MKTQPHYKYLALNNWNKYQTTKNGDIVLSWMKTYASLLDDDGWLNMSWTTRGVWEGLRLLRLRTGRNLPNDPKILARMLSEHGRGAVDVCQAIVRLTSDGFLIPSNQQNDSTKGALERDSNEIRLDEPTSVSKSLNTTKNHRNSIGINPKEI